MKTAKHLVQLESLVHESEPQVKIIHLDEKL